MTSYDPDQYPGNYSGGDQGFQAGPPPYQGPTGSAGYGAFNVATEKNSLGNWALGLGIAAALCCGPFTGIPAVILGFMGLQAAKAGRATNNAMSIVGIVLGALGIIFTIIGLVTGMFAGLTGS